MPNANSIQNMAQTHRQKTHPHTTPRDWTHTIWI